MLNVDDIVHIEVGQELVGAVDKSTSAIRALGTSANGLFVSGVNRSAGSFTVSAATVTNATDGIPLLAVNDYLFIRGDRDEISSPARGAIAGLEAWIPATAPTNALFFNVDRTQDITRLGGLRMDGSGGPIEEVLIDAAAKVAREGGSLDHYFMSYGKWVELEKALGSKVQYVDLMATATVGFRGIQIQGPKGMIKVMADRSCQSDRIWGLTLNTFKLKSLGEPVKALNLDGLKMLRRHDDDSVEARWGFRGNLGCHAPGMNICIYG